MDGLTLLVTVIVAVPVPRLTITASFVHPHTSHTDESDETQTNVNCVVLAGVIVNATVLE